MKQMTIHAHGQVFTFPLDDETGAWYDLDQKVSVSDVATIRINADREVYAILTMSDGKVYYGTIGDEEDDTLADNYPVTDGEEYIFYDHPETETCYV